MIPIDLSGKVALVTGVGDNESFAWYISKALQAAGARILLAVHPPMAHIAPAHLQTPPAAPSRGMPFNAGTFKPEAVIPCDVGYDTMDDVPAAIREDRRYTR